MSESTQCLTCKHYQGFWQCAAFDEIPEKIATGEHDHRQPYDGDKGIRWEPASQEAAEIEAVEDSE